MKTDKEYDQLISQLAELAFELEEALNEGASLNYELYCLEREIVKLSCQMSDERSNREFLSQALNERDGSIKA